MWKKIICGMFGVFLCFILLGLGGGRSGGEAGYARISAAEAKALMDGGTPYVLLDVRTEAEMRERHIQGAILIPYTEIRARAPSELPGRDTVILVYCRSGRRSAMAARELARMGYTKVYDFGGINDWPYATVTGTGTAKQDRP